MIKKSEACRGILAALLVTLLFGACYWSADNKEGGLILEIDAADLGASQLEEYDGFFFGWVVADDLMRGDQAAADEAFDEVNTALDEALYELETTGNLSDFSVDLAFPSIQLQASFFTGTSGSNTFAGLTAGREYLVVVEAYDVNAQRDIVGFTTVTVSAGETKTVTLDLSGNWIGFYQLLDDRYKLGYLASLGAIQIQKGSTAYYFDLLPGYTSDPELGSLTAFEFDSWYSSIEVLNGLGYRIAKSGNRPEIAATASVHTIENISPDVSWRILLTEWPDRAAAPLETYNFFISPPITIEPRETLIVPFVRGDGDGFSTFDLISIF